MYLFLEKMEIDLNIIYKSSRFTFPESDEGACWKTQTGMWLCLGNYRWLASLPKGVDLFGEYLFVAGYQEKAAAGILIVWTGFFKILVRLVPRQWLGSEKYQNRKRVEYKMFGIFLWFWESISWVYLGKCSPVIWKIIS